MKCCNNEHYGKCYGICWKSLANYKPEFGCKRIKDVGLNMQKQNMKLDMKIDIMEDALDFGDDLENDEEANDFYDQFMQEAGYNVEKTIPVIIIIIIS